MLTGVEWKNLDVTAIPQNETSEQTVEYTRGAASDLMVLDDNFISDAKLAIHGSTGAQLANLPNKNSVTVDGVTWSCKDNVAESVGDSTELDIVLTDKNGITKRSEVGKTFTGGE